MLRQQMHLGSRMRRGGCCVIPRLGAVGPHLPSPMRPRSSPHLAFKCSAVANGSTPAASSSCLPVKPSAAETARTIAAIVSEGTLSTLTKDGMPVGSPVSYTLDKEGATWVTLAPHSHEISNLRTDARCSLLVQPTAFPARAVAAVTLMGTIKVDEQSASGSAYRMLVDKAMYFGGLDESSQPEEVDASDLIAAEPDVLRLSAPELVKHWNEERAEDIYRIVSHQLHVPLSEMLYTELLWVDRLGMYVRTEVEGKQPAVVRVPFYRAVLDERDARSVITMAAQIAWEAERPYNPSAMLPDTAANN